MITAKTAATAAKTAALTFVAEFPGQTPTLDWSDEAAAAMNGGVWPSWSARARFRGALRAEVKRLNKK